MHKKIFTGLSERTIAKWLIIGIIGLVISGCSQAAAPNVVQTSPSVTDSGYPVAQEAYPDPAASVGAQAAAQASTDAYPDPAASVKQGPAFAINEPIKSTDTRISGTGPANVPIKIVNLTQGGSSVSETKIGADGTFTVDAAGSFGAGDRIAIMLGDTQGTNINREDFLSGPGYQDWPLVGILFDSVLVQ